MLRWTLIVLATLGFIGAVVSLISGLHGGVMFAVWTGVCIIGLVFERVRYKAILEAPPTGDWTATGERFVDSRSGRAVTVWFQASTGKRAYVGDPLKG